MTDLDVLVVGDANPDLVLRGDVVPRFGQEEQLLDGADLVLGGSSTITACGCARLGLRTAQVARVGADVFGDFTLAALARAGVDTGHVVRADAPTGLSVILSTVADRSILTLPGALAGLRAEEVPDALLRRARHLHVGGLFLLPELVPGLAGLLARAKAAGCSTSLDTNWDPSGRWEGVAAALPVVDFLFPNAAELRALTAGLSALTAGLSVGGAGRSALTAGLSVGGAAESPAPVGGSTVEDAAALVVAHGVTVVLKDGARGARAWWPGGECAAPVVPVEVVDTTGAGDSFNAGFLAAHLDSRPLPECAAWAAAAGSLSTRAAGGTGAQPTREELLAALNTR